MLGLGGHRHRAVTNIGFRPTVTQDGTSLSVETHVLDFAQDLYSKEAVLEFFLRLRDERRFESEKALIAQIGKDVGNTRRYFAWLERAVPQCM
jgi:riboflavin kinase/FMN adenylyltransferase